ncbi:MAG: hypothetical protein GXP38_14835 [Chloroflexi bacterium]|nr:hypothetical protein [Chloroflexota bacterium]
MDIKRVSVPTWLPITTVVLLLLGAISSPLIHRVFSEKQLASNVLLTAIPFILIFVAIILFFATLIVVAARLFGNNISEQSYRLVEYIAIAGIVLGIIGMFQPWFFLAYRYGFSVLLVSTLFYILWSHITPREDIEEENRSI